jgi:hypothetical protein
MDIPLHVEAQEETERCEGAFDASQIPHELLEELDPSF